MKHRFLPLLFLFAFLTPVTFSYAQTDVDLAAEMIQKGLDYLKSTQSVSGKGPLKFEIGPSNDPTAVYPMFEPKSVGHWSGNAGITALCLQAFLAQGYTVNDPVYGNTILNAINYIVSVQTMSGDHLGGIANYRYGYETPQCIVALNMAVKQGGILNPVLLAQIQNTINLALNYITQDINPAWNAVSWRYDRWYTSEWNGDMSVCQWNFLALNEMNYTDKNVYNKIYYYLNGKSAFSGNTARIGYQDPNTWARGNTCAGVWGSIICNGRGVAGAAALAQKYYNYLEQYSLAELFSPGNIGNHVYDGGGWYYYQYELAKALALGQKTNFAGGNWYTHMANNFWSWKRTSGGNYYWDDWGGQGANMETALVILCLQTNTIPINSTAHISFEGTGMDCIKFSVYDNLGNFAGQDEFGNWITNIPNSQWVATGPDLYDLEVELINAITLSVNIENICKGEVLGTLCYKTYINENLTDSDCFDIVLDDGQSIGAVGFVNSIGGLNVIIIIPPQPVPVMDLDPELLCINPFELGTLYNFEFTISETGNESSLEDIDITGSDLVDQFGNVIPGANFTFNPSNIAEIPAGGSTTVAGTLLIPGSFPLPPGLFEGIISCQSISGQTKAIQVTVGAPSMIVDPIMADVPATAGSTTFTITIEGACGNGWTITNIPSWITLSAEAGAGSQVITVNYAENLLGARTAELLISAPNAFPTEATFTVNQAEGNIVEGDQLIEFAEPGWYGISSFILPDNPALENLMTPIIENFTIMLSRSGIFWPGQGLNTIGNWNTYEGYKIKITEPCIFPINGIQANKTVTLPAGVSYLPVLSDLPVAADDILGAAADEGKLLYACNIHTFDVYWPGGTLYTLNFLEPGTGYLIYLFSPWTFNYDVITDNYSQPVEPVMPQNVPWTYSQTGDIHLIGFDRQILTALQSGDVIGVFNMADQCMGYSVYNGQSLVLAACGDDPTTQTTDGMAGNEKMYFKVFRPSTQELFELNVTFDPSSLSSDRYVSGGFSVVKSLETQTVISETSLSSLSIFPNPSNGIIHVSFGKDAGSVEISVVNIHGQSVLSKILEETGNQSEVTLDVSLYPKGIYFIRLTNKVSTLTEKLIFE